MGFLGGLFGRSGDRKDVATDRCMQCGMTKGAHTEWCPGAPDVAAAPAPESKTPEETAEETGETPPPM